jgi:hypothetical protein
MKKSNITPQVAGGQVSIAPEVNHNHIPVSADVSKNVISVSAAVTGGGSSKILYDTTEHWNARPQLVSKKGYLYIYSDYKTDSEGKQIAGIKVGNGVNFLIDMPFEDTLLEEHVNDMTIHITAAERQFWNNKITTSDALVQGTNLIFTKD